ncbi:hypothetical protein DICPUDRAFT_150905 [Dictyostelium purpureum]|uniref:Uncharacterized protein n=1 Tax=Dictyostelium purpureum TaxID=5786 RepID=F0ZHJ5_DICPU|nr:uncharacterized protein DICPUDRAFT_150905 [Dictyostelium purpureum]EGC36580.1 hypothetical protein DICPUDRAFT_150905 [Dictyostelium purpureum]|eukprot:XP_003286884.1 hypothetical protein DICPUDRAFT_150905 [Dictyostelium purpureum]
MVIVTVRDELVHLVGGISFIKEIIRKDQRRKSTRTGWDCGHILQKPHQHTNAALQQPPKSTKTNANVTFDEESESIYAQLEEGKTERYLGFNFNKKGIQSKLDQITEKILAQFASWKNATSTLRATIFEQIWYRRNKKNHEQFTYDLTYERILKRFKLICAAAWEREVKNINRIYKKLQNQGPANQRHHTMKIVNRLENRVNLCTILIEGLYA